MAWFQHVFWYCAGFPQNVHRTRWPVRAHSISGVVNQKDVSMPARTRRVDVEK